MSTTALVLISVLIGIAILSTAALIFLRKRRTEGLRTRFGPEYVRALQESGDRRQAEASLEERKKRVERFHLRTACANSSCPLHGILAQGPGAVR